MGLPEEQERPDRRKLNRYLSYLWGALEIRFADERQGQLMQRELLAVSEAYNFSLRQLEHAMTNIALVAAAVAPNNILIAPLVAGLCVMRQVNPELYDKARRGRLTWPEASAFLNPAPGTGIADDWSVDWWKFATGADMPDDKVQEHSRDLRRYNIHDRERLLPFMAEYIDQLMQNRGVPQG